jgi:hypothetical protein
VEQVWILKYKSTRGVYRDYIEVMEDGQVREWKWKGQKLNPEDFTRSESEAIANGWQPPLTVAALIEKLKTAPQDALVEVEGCDCTGECGGISIQDNGANVLITRMVD